MDVVGPHARLALRRERRQVRLAARLHPFFRRWRRVAPLAALLPAVAAAGVPLANAERGVATGTIEGEVTLPTAAAARTAERYTGASGAPRDIPTIPVVVFLEGAVADAPAPRAPGPLELVQRDETFHPGILVVPAGAEVDFPNDDPFFHNVFSYSRPKRFDLGRYRQGESKSVVFDKPGYIKVMCEVHQWMRAAIMVVENPYYAVVAESGRFRIDDVPVGRYRLVAEHFDRRPQTVEAEVPDGGTATVQIDF